MLDSNFEQCAVASGLVKSEQLESAWREMNGTGLPQPEEIPGRLAEIFVNRGILNRWQSQQLLAGRTRFTLGCYKIYDCIGHGGMGQVFKARHEVLNQVVAIKVLPLDKSTPQAVENFQNEIQALARLNHPNLVQAVDAGMDGNVYYLVTEYVSGPDLRRLVRSRGTLTQESAASIIVQVARGLQHAHDEGLVHRDIKPGNVIVMMNGIAKLSDLGLASPMDESDGAERQAKIVGTADYICPDQVRNPRKPLPIWDIYSLGCTLYYIVTGKVPYPGGTTREKIKAHMDEGTHPLDPSKLNPLLSLDFVEVIGDMMAKNPEERVPTANDVVRLLEPWSDGTPREIELVELDSSQSLNGQAEDLIPVVTGRDTSKGTKTPGASTPIWGLPPESLPKSDVPSALIFPTSEAELTLGVPPRGEEKTTEKRRKNKSLGTFFKKESVRQVLLYGLWILLGFGLGAGGFFLWLLLAKLF